MWARNDPAARQALCVHCACVHAERQRHAMCEFRQSNKAAAERVLVFEGKVSVSIDVRVCGVCLEGVGVPACTLL
jgi:hypothetical protein